MRNHELPRMINCIILSARFRRRFTREGRRCVGISSISTEILYLFVTRAWEPRPQKFIQLKNTEYRCIRIRNRHLSRAHTFTQKKIGPRLFSFSSKPSSSTRDERIFHSPFARTTRPLSEPLARCKRQASGNLFRKLSAGVQAAFNSDTSPAGIAPPWFVDRTRNAKRVFGTNEPIRAARRSGRRLQAIRR